MEIIDKLKKLFSFGGGKSKLIDIYVEDQKCGNKMKLLFRKSYDIQKVYEDDREAAHEINKVVVCDNCYNKIKLHITFDRGYNILQQEIENGRIISKKEFENK